MKKSEYKAIHKLSIYQLRNKELHDNQKCGCFYCESIYRERDVRDHIDGQTTIICPKCGIDSVIIETDLLKKFNKRITPEFLKEMNEYAF